MRSMESAAIAALPYLLIGLVISTLGLVVAAGETPLKLITVQLGLLVVFGFALAVRVAPHASSRWFTDSGLDSRGRLAWSGIVSIIIITGVVGLVTLASSAALRLDPSLQFLQLLSALDIAWVVAAIVIGGRWAWSQRMAAAVGGAIGVFCVWSIWNYLSHVGFTPTGGWIVDGSQLMRLVLPFDMMAAAAAVSVFVLGVRRRAAEPQPMEQLSAQS